MALPHMRELIEVFRGKRLATSLPVILLVALLSVALAACSVLSPEVTQDPTPTPDIEATIAAGVDNALATREAQRTPTPTHTLIPTPTPIPTATPTPLPTPTFTPLPTPTATPTALPTPTPIPTATPTPTPNPTPTPTTSPMPDLATMIANVRPSVVRIDTPSGLGTGVIFEVLPSENRTLVITNYHVIKGHSQVTVTVNDSTSYTGTVWGYDADRDLAVVSINGTGFQALDFGDTGDAPIGSEVVAVGYALGIPGSATVTRGIVSAMRYESDVDRWVIQTDAPINPGNSGGPLLSSVGEILGINTYVVRSTGSGVPVEGFGFAVSEVTVQQELPSLKQESVGPFPTPTPLPQAPGGVYTSDTYWYTIDVPSGWNLDASDDEAVVMWDPVTGATVWVQTEVIDTNVYPTLDSYVAEWHPAAAASWTDFEIVDERRVREDRIIQANEWTYTYKRDGAGSKGRTQWYVLGKHVVRVSTIAADAIWNMEEFSGVRSKLGSAQESFEPSAYISDQYGYSLALPLTWAEEVCEAGYDYCARNSTGSGQVYVAIDSAAGYSNVGDYGGDHTVAEGYVLDRSVLYMNRPDPSYRIDYERVAESGKTIKGATLITLVEGNAVWVFVDDYEENWDELSLLIDDIFLRVAVRQ